MKTKKFNAADFFGRFGIVIILILLCIFFTLVFARIAAKLANKASAKTLNRATGVILVILGVVVLGFKYLA